MNTIQIFFGAYKHLLIVLYLSFMGMACVLAAMLYLGAPPDPVVAVTFMGLVFFIYIINRFTDIREDFTNDTAKAVFFEKHKTLLKAGISTIVLAVIALAAANKLSLFHVILIGTGILYSYRFIPWYKKDRGFFYLRIKELPLVKNFTVSLLWGGSIFILPVLFSKIQVSSPFTVVILAAAVVISTFNNTFFNDIMDVLGDKLIRNQTVPAILGEAASYRILWIINLMWLSFVGGIFTLGLIDVYHFYFLLILALYPLAYMVPYQKRWFKKSAVEFIMELDLLIVACGLSLLSIGF